MSITAPVTVDKCCEWINPCKALCLLQNVEVQIALGKQVTSYTLGEEKFSFRSPSLADIRALIKIYQARCPSAPGATRRRAKVCFVNAEPYCGRCGRKCGGGCR